MNRYCRPETQGHIKASKHPSIKKKICIPSPPSLYPTVILLYDHLGAEILPFLTGIMQLLFSHNCPLDLALPLYHL
jgi:hypothetical protein